MRARVAGDEHAQRVGHVLKECLGQATRRGGATARRGTDRPRRRRRSALRRRIAARSRVVHARARPAAPPASTPRKTRSEISARLRSPTRRSTSCSTSRPVARVSSERCCRSSSTRCERTGIDQLAQLLLAEQLAQQVAIERQRGRAALGVGRVALVHVGGDVVEQQRGGERRGGRRLDLDERYLACVQRAQQRLQAGHVEDVLQALPVGLKHDREVRVAPGHLEQALGLQALLPQRRAPAGIGARDQQRARGVLAEARAEQRRAAELGRDRLLHLLGLEQDQLGDAGDDRAIVGSRAVARSEAPVARVLSSSRSGRCRTMPSSEEITSASRPKRSRMRADRASPQAACTRPP